MQEPDPRPVGDDGPAETGVRHPTDFAPPPSDSGEEGKSGEERDPDSDSEDDGGPEGQATRPMKTARLGQFRGFTLEEKIGEGGMGIVYRAYDPDLARPVAIKKIHPRLAGAEQYSQRFLAEARSVAAVIHPNVAQIFSIHPREEETPPYFVMEFVEGESTEAYLEREGPFPPEQALDLALQAARGLQAAYYKGIVHRDIKPSNLLITERGEVKLVDFGLARQVSDIGGLTEVGMILGTPHYVSPEQGRGHRVDHRSDIYSLGCTLFFLLTGKEVFSGKSKMDVIVCHAKENPPRLGATRPDLPASLDGIVARMLQKQPEDRYQSYDELIGDLSAARRALSGSGTRHSWARSAVAMLIVVPILVAAAFGLRDLLGEAGLGEEEQLKRQFGPLYKEGDRHQILEYDYTDDRNQERLQQFIRYVGTSDERTKIPTVHSGLRWRNYEHPIVFPYFDEIAAVEILGLEALGEPDFELVLGQDPGRPDDFLRIFFSFGGRRNDNGIDCRQSGEAVVPRRSVARSDFLLEDNARYVIRLEREEPEPASESSPPSEPEARFHLTVLKMQPERPVTIEDLRFQIPARRLPRGGRVMVRAAGNRTRWSMTIDKVRIEGTIDPEKTAADLWDGRGT